MKQTWNSETIDAMIDEIDRLERKVSDLQDFAIWLTGCGYDFTQHEHFCKERDRLLKER